MLIKSKNSNRRVKFISYTGEYPNLCSGVLTLEIDGKEYKFGHNFMNRHYHEDIKDWVQEDEDPRILTLRSSGQVVALLTVMKIGIMMFLQESGRLMWMNFLNNSGMSRTK